MKTHAIRINKMFLTSMLILSLGYTTTLTFSSNVEVDGLTIATGDKVILNTGVTMTVATGAVSITGTLQMDGNALLTVPLASTVPVTVEAAGTLDMNGTSRLKLTGDLTFNGGRLQAEDGTGIDLQAAAEQEIAGTIVGNFKSITNNHGGGTVFNMTATIEDSLDTGGEDFTISNLKTLTMDAGSVVEVEGGDWIRTGTLVLNATSKVLYTGSATAMTNPAVDYGNLEHNSAGTLTQEAGLGLVVVGTFTNTAGDFAASQDITAAGIVWEAGIVTTTPSQTWDIGTGGITINGGTFKGTSGTFTVAGDWTNTAGAFTHNGSNVDFDGAAAQLITSRGSNFSSVSISNTANIVSLGDNFGFVGANLTIDNDAKFALAGFAFSASTTTSVANAGTGIFMLNGNEVTTAALVIPGATKFVAPGSLTMTNTLGALEDVTFDASGQTITFSHTIAYISGDIIVENGTTLDMDTHGLSIADAKTVTNNGTWSDPTGGTLTCLGDATFAGLTGMNFYEFSATVADKELIFKDGLTYKVLNNLTLTGTHMNEITLSTAAGGTASISNTGGAQAVTYVKVDNVDAFLATPITATNSWDVNRGQPDAVDYWVFGAMLFTANTSGDWDAPGTWEEGVIPAATDNIIVSTLVNLQLSGDQTINDVEVTGTITVAGNDLTVNGALDNNGTMTVSSGTVDVEGAYDASGGANTFTGDGHLELAGVVTSVGTLTGADHGTVTYNGIGAQNIPAGDDPQTYVNLVVGGGGGIKSLQGDVVVSGDLTVENLTTLAMGANTLGVTGASTITGTLDVAGSTLTLTGASVVGGTITVSSGIVDANGSFTAAGGNVTFTGAGNLRLAGAVASLGTLTGSTHGTVTYDAAGDQSIPAGDDPQTYVNLIVGGGTGTKTLLGGVVVSGAFTTDASVTTAMGAKNLTVAGATVINGIVTISTGTLDADDTFDATGANDATGGIITFSGDGNLLLGGVVTSLGALTAATHGTVTYDGAGAQTIVSDIYVNLIAGGAADQTKTLAGNVTASGAFTTDASVTTAIGAFELDVAGATVINGTVTISTGTLDANGTFNATGANDATGGFVTFTAAGNLELQGVVTSLGTLTNTLGKVTYDGGAGTQDVFADTYNDLTIGGGTGTKELAGNVIVNQDLRIDAGVTLDVSSGDRSLNVARQFINDGVFTAQEGTVTFDGNVDQPFTSSGSVFFNIIYDSQGASRSLQMVDNLTITNDLTITNGTFDLGQNTATLTLAGDLLISAGGKWLKGGLVTFNGGVTPQTFTDANIPPIANLGSIAID